MAGMGDRAFREICAGFGASYTVSEMVSAKGLEFDSQKSAELLELGGRPYRCPQAVQIFGNEPKTMAEAVKTAAGYSPDVIDINMGCPAPKITNSGSGSALMKNLPLAREIIGAVVSVARQEGIPVTVKMRKGWDDNLINAVDAAKIAEEMGASAIAVHGRTRQQMYSPPVDLDIIARVKEAVSIPVIGNGGIESAKGAAEMYRHTGCDLVMVGQGSYGAPWLFAQIAAYMEDETILPDPSLEEKMRIMIEHISLSCRYKGQHRAMREARSHVVHYFKERPGSAELRRRAGGLKTMDDLRALAEYALEN